MSEQFLTLLCQWRELLRRAHDPCNNAYDLTPIFSLIGRLFIHRRDRRPEPMAPVVSVLLPAFNAADFIESAINSALTQTLHDIEIVIVDDGSTDRTWEVIAACARRDPRIVPVQQARQMGPSAARNTAIERARGRWLALLDADDEFLPGRLSELVTRAEALDADLLADNLLLRDFSTGQPLGRALPDDVMTAAGPLTLLEILQHDMPDLPMRERLGFVQPIMRRAFLLQHGIRYHEDIRSGEDLLLYCECVARGARFHLVPGAWYVCSVRPGSVTMGGTLTHHHRIANQRILDAVGTGDTELIRTLRRRQVLIDFNCFKESIMAHSFAQGLRDMRQVPSSYFLRRIGGALYRRVSGAAAALAGRPAS